MVVVEGTLVDPANWLGKYFRIRTSIPIGWLGTSPMAFANNPELVSDGFLNAGQREFIYNIRPGNHLSAPLFFESRADKEAQHYSASITLVFTLIDQ